MQAVVSRVTPLANAHIIEIGLNTFTGCKIQMI